MDEKQSCMLCMIKFTKQHDEQKLCLRCIPKAISEIELNSHKTDPEIFGWLGEEYEADLDFLKNMRGR